MSELILTTHGMSGSIELFPNSLIIKKRMGGISRNHISGNKEIYFDSIKNINFKDANSMTHGFIQFETAENKNDLKKGTLFMGPTDAYSIIFNKSQQFNFNALKAKITELRNNPKSPTIVQQTSQADELAKFADLRDKGVITPDEFEAKKKQILGL